jgi:hypothetical protein
LATAAGVAIVILAVVETVNALVAPALAPTPEDWEAAAEKVRQGFRKGDLIVAAPDFADQEMRRVLGDLVPVEVAGRMDAARFGRVWEISQRGATSHEAEGRIVATHEAGGLTVRLVERAASTVTFDFVAGWTQAVVTRRQGRTDTACPRAGDRFQCPDLAHNFVMPAVLEIGNTLRHALYVQPVAGATVVVEFPAVAMGRELAVASGLHHVWFRKAGEGTVKLAVWIDGKPVGTRVAGNRTGWHLDKLDTSGWAGRTATVRFEVTSAEPFGRHFGFAAEARN